MQLQDIRERITKIYIWKSGLGILSTQHGHTTHTHAPAHAHAASHKVLSPKREAKLFLGRVWRLSRFSSLLFTTHSLIHIMQSSSQTCTGHSMHALSPFAPANYHYSEFALQNSRCSRGFRRYAIPIWRDSPSRPRLYMYLHRGVNEVSCRSSVS